jgi:hypothetical protein
MKIFWGDVRAAKVFNFLGAENLILNQAFDGVCL